MIISKSAAAAAGGGSVIMVEMMVTITMMVSLMAIRYLDGVCSSCPFSPALMLDQQDEKERDLAQAQVSR